MGFNQPSLVKTMVAACVLLNNAVAAARWSITMYHLRRANSETLWWIASQQPSHYEWSARSNQRPEGSLVCVCVCEGVWGCVCVCVRARVSAKGEEVSLLIPDYVTRFERFKRWKLWTYYNASYVELVIQATYWISNAKDRRLERFNTSACLGLSIPVENVSVN